MPLQTNHIAILVRDIDAITRTFPSFCVLHPKEDQEREGTREQYVDFGPAGSPSLLLVQAIADGPYARALQKRGPGLHHIGCVTTDLDVAVRHCGQHRLLLHPISLSTYQRWGVWLCRPGVPFLIELMRGTLEETSLPPCRLQLPAQIRIPEYVQDISSNLVIENSGDSRLGMCNGDQTVWMDLGMS